MEEKWKEGYGVSHLYLLSGELGVLPKITRRDRISRILVNVKNASNRSIKDKDLTIKIERRV